MVCSWGLVERVEGQQRRRAVIPSPLQEGSARNHSQRRVSPVVLSSPVEPGVYSISRHDATVDGMFVFSETGERGFHCPHDRLSRGICQAIQYDVLWVFCLALEMAMRSCSSSPTRWKGASHETPPQQARAVLGEVSHEDHNVSRTAMMPTDGDKYLWFSFILHHISQKTLCFATRSLTRGVLPRHGP